MTPAQIVFNWAKDRVTTTSPIIGARTMVQFQDKMAAEIWAIEVKHRTRLEEVSDLPGTYPHGFIQNSISGRERL